MSFSEAIVIPGDDRLPCSAALVVRDGLDVYSVQPAQFFIRQHVRCRTAADVIRTAHQDDGIGEIESMVGVMRRQQDAHPVGHQFAQQRQDLCLMVQVETSCRLIQHEHRRFRDDGPGDQEELLLAAAQRRELPVGKVSDIDAIQRLSAAIRSARDGG